MLEQVRKQQSRGVKLQLPLERPSIQAKKPDPKKGAQKEKETARMIILKTEDDQKQVKVLYNAKLDSLKIKYDKNKIVYSYLQLPQKIQAYNQNTYQLYKSFKTKNKKIRVDTATKTLIFYDKRQPLIIQPVRSPEILIVNEPQQQIQPNIRASDFHDKPQISEQSESNIILQHQQVLLLQQLQQMQRRNEETLKMTLEKMKEYHLEKSEQCAQTHFGLGKLYIRRGRRGISADRSNDIAQLKEYERIAINQLQTALKILQSLEYSRQLILIKALTLNQLGLAYIFSNRQRAKKYFCDALSQEDMVDLQLIFDINLNLGKLHNMMKKYDQAYKYLSQCLNMVGQGPEGQINIIEAYCQLQQTCLRLKRYEQGIQIIEKLVLYTLDNSSKRAEVEKIKTKWATIMLKSHEKSNITHLKAFRKILVDYFDEEWRVFPFNGLIDRLEGK